MVWIDYTIIGAVVLSTLIGFTRGFLREMISFIAWLGALFIAWTFHQELADELVQWTSNPLIRLIAAILILIIGVMLLGAILGRLFYVLLKKKGFTGMDRVLGILFGMARGIILVAMLVYLVALTPARNSGWWQESSLIDDFQALAEGILKQVPQSVADKLKDL